MFQSLLYWNTSENAGAGCMSTGSHPSFNPCCIGIPLRIAKSPNRMHVNSRFNPCCIGIPLRIIPSHPHLHPETAFQSLLYWNTSENTRQGRRVRTGTKGFNPCCIGIPLRMSEISLCNNVRNMFQSLLYWNTSENSAIAA